MLSWEPINRNIHGLFLDNELGIIPKHNFATGQRNYILATLEQIIGYLSRDEIDDNMIKYLSSSLYKVAQKRNDGYYEVVQEVLSFEGINQNSSDAFSRIKRDYSQNVLSDPETVVLCEIAQMNINEYIMKSDYQRCDYGAMLTLTNLAYQIILQSLNNYVNSIEMFVDTNNKLVSWQYDFSNNKNDSIWIEWTALDKIDFFFSTYHTQCGGLSENSMWDLASADAVEEQFIKNKERKTVSYNMLVKQYCGVIEQEVNEIIQLTDLPGKPDNHLMWKRMMDYVRDNKIQLVGGEFTLIALLSDLYDLRNLSTHGEKITKEQYEKLEYYKERQLFELISWTKLDLTGRSFEPLLPNI